MGNLCIAELEDRIKVAQDDFVRAVGDVTILKQEKSKLEGKIVFLTNKGRDNNPSSNDSETLQKKKSPFKSLVDTLTPSKKSTKVLPKSKSSSIIAPSRFAKGASNVIDKASKESTEALKMPTQTKPAFDNRPLYVDAKKLAPFCSTRLG